MQVMVHWQMTLSNSQDHSATVTVKCYVNLLDIRTDSTPLVMDSILNELILLVLRIIQEALRRKLEQVPH